MFRAQLIEHLPRGAGATGRDIFKSLADAFLGAGFRCEVPQPLVLGGALEDSFGFAVYGEDNGPLRLPELLEEFDGVVAERGEGLDILGDVDHGCLP
jgi:hypothetical protein